MTLRAWLSFGSVAVIAILVAAVYWKGRSHGVDVERRKTTVAQAQAETAKVEADLARRATARMDVFVRRQADGAEVARRYSMEALNVEDADKPLAVERAARLRDADRELCELSPNLDGCASAR
jgi:hypothetical protein